MFIIKKPKWLEFIAENFDPRISKAARRQVRTMNGISNTKIVKFVDGSVYLKVGGEMYPLRNLKMPVEYVMMENKGEMFVEVGRVSNKYFVTEINKIG